MKKTITALLACVFILTAASCGNGEKKPEESTTTSATANENGVVTQVAIQADEQEDTTEQSIEYLKEKAPLFVKYLEVRMQYPLTYEIETETENGIASAGIYIKDKSKVSTYSSDGTGASSTTIYSDDKIYYIDDALKTYYVGDVPVSASEEMVSNYLLTIDISSAMENAYNTDEKELDGVMYKYESIATPKGALTEYYYDMETEMLKYIVSNGNVNKVTALSNTVKEEAFELPSDYTESTMEEYFASAQG